MLFNVKEFLAFSRRALLPERDTPYRMTPKRLGVLAGFYLLFFATETTTRLACTLDDLLYPGYKRQPVREPVFILGNPRSGTTFLQHLLAKDQRNFSSMRLWEILFAPSVLQRRLVTLLDTLDQKLGSPIRRLVKKLDATLDEENEIHRTGLLTPEEDQYMLVHAWSTLAVWQFAAILGEQADRYTHFDVAIPEPRRERILTFYRRMIQRHLYAHQDDGAVSLHYLSKNPSATPKIDSLLSCFPDAHIIYLVRNPLDMVPSMVSTLDFTWALLGDPPDPYACREYVIEMSKHWYRYPLERLAREPEARYTIVRFDDLVWDPDETVRGLYERFGLTVDSGYAQVLEEETRRSRNHVSHHTYSLSEMGLTRERIVAEYRDVFDRFGFETREEVGA